MVVAVDRLDKVLGCFGVSATRAARGDWSCCVGVASREEDAAGDLARVGTSAGRVIGGILSARVLLCAQRGSVITARRVPSGEESDVSLPLGNQLDWVKLTAACPE